MKYDIIGDIHGCYDELLQLLGLLGYEKKGDIYLHPKERQLVFVGDAMDRGPESLNVLRLLFSMQDEGILHYTPGNHCNKLYRFFKGNRVQLINGLETTVNEWNALPQKERKEFQQRYLRFYEALPYYLEFGDDLVVAHAGIKENMIGKPASKSIITFVLYGDITGQTLSDGRPVRRDWAKEYKGDKWILYGHTPVEKPYLMNNTVNIDTGCVFGGSLSAFRFPEKTVVSVPSNQEFTGEKFHIY